MVLLYYWTHSLISNKNCEEVRASSNVTTFRLEKKKLNNFLKNETKIGSLLETEIFEEEIAQFIEDYLVDNSNNKISFKNIFLDLKDSAKIIISEVEIIKAIKNDDFVFIDLQSLNQKIYKRIDSIESFLESKIN